MSRILDFFLITLSYIVLTNNCVSGQKVPVTVLYETLCPDSLKFINVHLYPSWAEIAPYVHLKLVPFGKSSSVNGGLHFNCQHGPMECAGNKIQSCALNEIDNIDAQVPFVHCFMNSYPKRDNGQSCAAKIGLNWNAVDYCYKSATGTLLQLRAEAVTKQILPYFVPTIIFDGVFNQKDQDESLVNFKGVICKYINKLHPGVCRT